MRRISFEIDEDVLALVERYARAANTSIERILKDHLTTIAKQNDIERQRRVPEEAEDIARLAPIEIHNPSHREILSALKCSPDRHASARDEAHDRAKARAETYAANRRKLLELIDRTQGDLGRQTWDRSRIYER
jgi:hypothetical protein